MTQDADHNLAHRFLQLVCAYEAVATTEDIEKTLEESPHYAYADIFCASAHGELEKIKGFTASDRAACTTLGGPNNWPPLLYACFSRFAVNGHQREPRIRQSIQNLLRDGADANSSFMWLAKVRLTALFAACQRGNADMAEMLLEAGAKPNDGYSLLHAVKNEHFHCAGVMLAFNADINTTDHHTGFPPLHWLLDWDARPNAIRWLLEHGADPNMPAGPLWETPLHVAMRRRRLNDTRILLQAGANVDACTSGGLTPYAHGRRRGFNEVAAVLEEHGCDTTLSPIDEMAIALFQGDSEQAQAMLRANPGLVSKFGPEDERMLPDSISRPESLAFLLDAGVPIDARGLDGGTALHQAGWFGSADAARLLIERGAPVDISGDDHDSTPLGWAAHGSRYSARAAERSEAYVKITEMLLDAGASLASPINPDRDPHGGWLLADASDAVADVLRRYGAKP